MKKEKFVSPIAEVTVFAAQIMTGDEVSTPTAPPPSGDSWE